MGMMDAFTAEDRTQIKVSSLYSMLKEGAKAELLINAVKCRVPYDYIMQMATGKSDELAEYKGTGQTPEQIIKLNDDYKDLCEQVKKLQEENRELLSAQEQMVNATKVDSSATAENVADEATQEASETVQGGDDQNGKKRIDIGKIMALKNAGWKVKDIADEMRMESSAVSNAIWRYNRQNDNN